MRILGGKSHETAKQQLNMLKVCVCICVCVYMLTVGVYLS